MKNSDKILHAFLVENKMMSEREFNSLNEDVKVESIRVVASELLKNVIDASKYIDTAPIDQSRGDIKSFRWLQDIQQAIAQVEAIIERSTNIVAAPLVKEYISVIIKSIYNLNKFAPNFKEAYRNKKTILILRYQSVVASIISAVAYLFSSIVDFSNNSIAIKDPIRIEETSAYRTLVQFNTSCDTGELRIITEDVDRFRTFYNEVSSENMASLLEASDIFSVVIDSAKNLYNSLDRGGKTTNLIYKAVGIIVALISIREIFNTLSRSKYSIQELLGNIKNFTNLSMASLPKLLQFGSRYRADAEENSKLAQRDTIQNNKEIAISLKELPSPSTIDYVEPVKDKVAQPTSSDDFFF